MNFIPGGHPICVDSGASCSISTNKFDFIEFTPTTNTVLCGITSGLQIEGKGTLHWTITNDSSDEIDLYIRDSLYVPLAPMCLLSPQQLLQQTNQNNDGFIVKDTYGILHFSGYKKTIYYNSSNNLPIFFTAPKFTTPPCHTLSKELSSATAALLSSEDLHTDTINLSATQRKLLLRHYQLGHLHMARIQSSAREGLLGPNNADIASCDAPLCKACIHGKQHRRPISSASPGPLDNNHLKPGDCVSCDQLESTSLGLIPVHKGTPTNSSYHAGTLFIDHASRYLYFTPQISTGAIEAVQAKQDFEFHASSFNQTIKRYHSNNGIFNSKLFKDACTLQKQHINFCGVDAHHQNGLAERYIRTITERARTMLIHAMICWPDIITERLWPFALCLSVDIHNATPNAVGLTPEELFSNSKSHPRLHTFHPFGCPIYVLEPALRQGHKIPKWKPRSRVGVYLGMSPDHLSTAPLVLSTTTGLISPQFHVIFDNQFTTTDSLHTNK
jgi:hypothetical protein